MSPILSIIIPAYNEGGNIITIIKKVMAVTLPCDFKKQLVIVDDGSTDNTAQLVEEFVASCSDSDSQIEFVCLPKNQGKGMAIRQGLERVVGEYVVIQDADDELDPNDLAPMLEKMLAEQLQVVYGSRFLDNSTIYSSKSFYWGTKVLSVLTNILYRQHITDEATCYKMFRTTLLESINLKCVGFEFCPEVTAKVCRKGIKIAEVPIKYTPRSIADGKKIRATDGFKAMYYLIKYRFIS